MEEARVEAIFTTAEGSAPMERREYVDAIEGGLRGDRYCRGTGHYTPYDVCEVTLIDAAAIDRIREEHGIDLSGSEHRRNLVVRGADLEALLDATVRVGDALLRGTRRRPPCAHVEEVAGEAGLARALKGSGGICADVVEAGRIREGNGLELVEADPRTVGERIADRLRGDD